MKNPEIFKKFASTEEEVVAVELIAKGMKNQEAAKQLGITLSSFRRRLLAVKRNMDKAGVSPNDPDLEKFKSLAEDHYVNGYSTLYKNKPDGTQEKVLEWVKTNHRKDAFDKYVDIIAEALKDSLPRVPAIENSVSSENTMTVYPMGDPHIGLLTYAEETGEDFDIEIATNDLCAAVARLVSITPPSEEALIVNLGDFYHSDTMDNKTWRSGHILDVAGRWDEILLAGIKAMRTAIETALTKHEKVKVINAIGNHDDHSSRFLSVCLNGIFENNPRVTIETAPTATHYHKYHNTLIGVHHGHSIKSPNLPLVMASEVPELWGSTNYRVWLTGHIHHDTVKEYNGCTVETFRTLANRDAYAASHGYLSHRDMKAIVYDPEYGEIERYTVSIARVRKSMTQ